MAPKKWKKPVQNDEVPQTGDVDGPVGGGEAQITTGWKQRVAIQTPAPKANASAGDPSAGKSSAADEPPGNENGKGAWNNKNQSQADSPSGEGNGSKGMLKEQSVAPKDSSVTSGKKGWKDKVKAQDPYEVGEIGSAVKEQVHTSTGTTKMIGKTGWKDKEAQDVTTLAESSEVGSDVKTESDNPTSIAAAENKCWKGQKKAHVESPLVEGIVELSEVKEEVDTSTHSTTGIEKKRWEVKEADELGSDVTENPDTSATTFFGALVKKQIDVSSIRGDDDVLNRHDGEESGPKEAQADRLSFDFTSSQERDAFIDANRRESVKPSPPSPHELPSVKFILPSLPDVVSTVAEISRVKDYENYTTGMVEQSKLRVQDLSMRAPTFDELRLQSATLRQVNAQLRDTHDKAEQEIQLGGQERKAAAVKLCREALAQIPPLVKITIIGANGVRNPDLLSQLDLYCVCVIPQRRFRLETQVVKSSNKPVWNHVHVSADVKEGDCLEFRVFDKDSVFEAYLGKALLESSQFFPNGFDGSLGLLDVNGCSEASTLSIRVEILGVVDKPSEDIHNASVNEELARISRDLRSALKKVSQKRYIIENELSTSESKHEALRDLLHSELQQRWDRLPTTEAQIDMMHGMSSTDFTALPLEELRIAVARRDAALLSLQDSEIKRNMYNELIQGSTSSTRKIIDDLQIEVSQLRSELLLNDKMNQEQPAFMKSWQARLDITDDEMSVRASNVYVGEAELSAEKSEATSISAKAEFETLKEEQWSEELSSVQIRVREFETRKQSLEEVALPMGRQSEQLAAVYEQQKRTMFNFSASLQRRFEEQAVAEDDTRSRRSCSEPGLRTLMQEIARMCDFPEVAFLKMDVRGVGRLNQYDLHFGLLVGLGLDYIAMTGLSIGDLFALLDQRQAGVVCPADLYACCPDVWETHGAQPPSVAEKLRALPWARIGGATSAHTEFAAIQHEEIPIALSRKSGLIASETSLSWSQFEELLCDKLFAFSEIDAQILFKELASDRDCVSLEAWRIATSEPAVEVVGGTDAESKIQELS